MLRPPKYPYIDIKTFALERPEAIFSQADSEQFYCAARQVMEVVCSLSSVLQSLGLREALIVLYERLVWLLQSQPGNLWNTLRHNLRCSQPLFPPGIRQRDQVPTRLGVTHTVFS